MFFEEAIDDRNERKRLDLLLRVAFPCQQLVAGFLFVAIITLVLWVVFGSMPRTMTVEGLLVKAGKFHEVAMHDSGKIVELHVSVSDTVSPGDAIARQTVPGLDREIAYLQDKEERLRKKIPENTGTHADINLLELTGVALLQLEAQRASRSQVVSHGGGEVEAIYATSGEFLNAGSVLARIREQDALVDHVVATVPAGILEHIHPGSLVEVDIPTTDGNLLRMPGEVVSLTDASNFQNTVENLLPPGDGEAHVGIAFEKKPDLTDIHEGTPCRIRVTLEHDAPFRILGFG